MPQTVYALATMDTKADVLCFVADTIRKTGLEVTLVDLSTRGSSEQTNITAQTVAASHPDGPDFAGANGLEALTLCKTHDQPIHLLATDLVMPQMGGDDLARKAQETLPGLKVLFLSGYTGSGLRNDGRLDADAFFLQKPFTPAAMTEMVRAVLDAEESTPIPTS